MFMKKERKSSLMGRIAPKLLVALALLLVLGGCLTACGGGRATVTLDPDDVVLKEGEDNQLSAAELTLLAGKIAESTQGLTIREYLVAAMNGYDMTDKDFNDDKVGTDELPAQPEKAGEFAYNVLRYESFKLENTAVYEKMTPADVAALVEALKTKVSTESDMDFFTMIFHWIALGFEWLIKVPGFGSFILGLVYFSVVVELIMLPMGIHQQKNSRKQALLRPKEMAIRKKYAGRNDQVTQQKVSQEIQEMYQKEGFNPMSGCLPLILSLIIIIPLYNLVIDPMKYMMGASSDLSAALSSFATASKAAGGLGLDLKSTSGTIELLSQIRSQGLEEAVISGMPNFAYFTNGETCALALEPIMSRIPAFTVFGLNFGLTPNIADPSWLLVVPVLTFVSYFASTKFTRKLSYQPAAQDQATGCSNKMMDITMPLMSVFFTFMVPAAVGLYWIFKSLIGMLKSFILAKAMPLPQFTEADFKAAEKEMAAKEKHRPAKKNPGGNPNVRSLHHIDDDDDLPPVPPRAATYVEDEDAPADAEGAYLGEATLKDDDRPEPKKKKDKKNKKGDSAVADSTDDFAISDEDFATEPRDTDQE